MSLDGFSLVPLVKELAKKLVGGRIDKITQPNKQTVIISAWAEPSLADFYKSTKPVCTLDFACT